MTSEHPNHKMCPSYYVRKIMSELYCDLNSQPTKNPPRQIEMLVENFWLSSENDLAKICHRTHGRSTHGSRGGYLPLFE